LTTARYLKTILEITAEAAEIPRGHFRQGLAVAHKADKSPVTEADQATERFIRDAILSEFPDHAIFGEEFGISDNDSPWQWIIDPIDGTRSFISGMPLYGMLIALLHKGQPTLGVVRMPELDEVYTGTPEGAFLNGTKRLSVSGQSDLAEAFIYINEADKIMAGDGPAFQRLNSAGLDRRYCYDCYPHMLVASGQADACVDYDLKPYDFLAFEPVIRAAGGVTTDWQGKALDLNSDGRVVSAATPALHSALLALL